MTIAVCDLCHQQGKIELTIKVKGDDDNEAWDVCFTCYNKPFRPFLGSELLRIQASYSLSVRPIHSAMLWPIPSSPCW